MPAVCRQKPYGPSRRKKDSINDTEAAALVKPPEEIDPRGAFKERSSFIKRRLAEA